MIQIDTNDIKKTIQVDTNWLKWWNEMIQIDTNWLQWWNDMNQIDTSWLQWCKWFKVIQLIQTISRVVQFWYHICNHIGEPITNGATPLTMVNLSRLLDRREAKGGRSLQGIVVAEAGKCSRWAHNLLKRTSSLLEGATWITSTDHSETHLHSTFPLLRICKQSTYRLTHTLKRGHTTIKVWATLRVLLYRVGWLSWLGRRAHKLLLCFVRAGERCSWRG